MPTPTRTTTPNFKGQSLRAVRLALVAGLACGWTSSVALSQHDDSTITPNQRIIADYSNKSPQDRVPIRKITLYRSGVGYFERSGQIDANAEIQLRFNTDQINDILKSMVLLDLDGGRIESVSYGSKEPLAKRLASFGVNIADNPTLPALLNQLRGAPIKVQVPADSITGTVLGIEQRTVSIKKDAEPIPQPYLNLVTPSGLRSIAIADVSSFEILDKTLSEELNKALSALAEYRADRTKTVDLRFAGTGSRRVVVGYVHEMPVWKTSYRLVIPENPKADPKGGEIFLQGWAIVENTTDQDWTDVRLGLVSGRPVSFQMDLYEPLFMTRPWVSVPTIAGVLPRAYALGADLMDDEDAAGGSGQSPFTGDRMQSKAEVQRNAGRMIAPGSPAPAPAIAAESMNRYEGITGDSMVGYAQQAGATPAEVGEVFQYQIDQPVSLERQRSAMIPIVTTNIPGRRVSIFNSSEGSEYPRRGIEITNNADLQLLAGPVSVYDGSAYAGDAQIGQIPKGDKRLLSYALDLNVTALNNTERKDTVTNVRISDGLLVLTSKLLSTTKYDFKNQDSARDRTLIVEHAKWNGWNLVDTAKPSEETKDLYRFEIGIEPGKTATFEVKQEMVQEQRTQIMGQDIATLLAYNKSGKLSSAVLKAVQEAAAKQSAINATEREIEQLNAQVQEINNEQTRIRENMRTIERSSQLYTRYMTKLTEQETTIEDLNQRKADAQKRLEEQRQGLAAYLRGLNVE